MMTTGDKNEKAALVYEEISELYQTMPQATDIIATLNEIADYEEEAWGLYGYND